MAQTWRVCTGTIQSHCGAVAPSAVSLSCTNVSSCASLKTSYLPETKRKTPFYVNWKSSKLVFSCPEPVLAKTESCL